MACNGSLGIFTISVELADFKLSISPPIYTSLFTPLLMAQTHSTALRGYLISMHRHSRWNYRLEEGIISEFPYCVGRYLKFLEIHTYICIHMYNKCNEEYGLQMEFYETVLYCNLCFICHRHNKMLKHRGIMNCLVKSYLESFNMWITDTLNHTLSCLLCHWDFAYLNNTTVYNPSTTPCMHNRSVYTRNE